MHRNPDYVFLGQIGIWDSDDGAEESLDLYFDLTTFECMVCAVRFPDGNRETTYGIRAFLRRVPDATPVVRRLLLDKLDPARSEREARIYRPIPTPAMDDSTTATPIVPARPRTR
jgi:hypothetical protein